MRQIKRWLAGVLIVAMILPLCSLQTAMAGESRGEDRDYAEQVVENYQEYLDATQGAYWLLYDGRYHYELMAEEVKHATSSEKLSGFSRRLDMETAFTVMKEKLTVDDCTKYLATIMTMMERGMADNVQSMAEYDSTKKTSDFLWDIGALAGDLLGLKEVTGEAKRIVKAMGFASDTVDYLLKVEDGKQDLIVALQQYKLNETFLTVVAENTSYQEMEMAAKRLLGILECQVAYGIQKCSEQVTAAGKYAWKASGDLIDEGLGQWIEANKEQIAKKWKWDKYLTLDEALPLAKQICGALKKVKVGADIGILLGDIYIGNEFRYLKEAMLLDDMTEALHVGIQEYNPAQAKKESKKVQLIQQQVPLLEALCAVRIRGEYCANMMAQAEDTVFGFLTVNEEEENELTLILEEDLEYLRTEYRLLSEIFLMDDFVVSLLWHTLQEETYISNGNLFCTAQISYPEVGYANSNDADEKISDYLKKHAQEMNDQYLADFEWKGPNAEYRGYDTYYNTAKLSFYGNQRMDETVISIVDSLTYYYAGGNHGIYGIQSFTFDTESGELLRLTDVLTGKEAYEKLADLVYQYVDPEKVAQDEHEYIQEGARDVLRQYDWKDNGYSNWYFTPNGLCFVYPPNTIAAAIYGFIEAEIPYSELQGIVEDKYLHPTMRSEKGTDIYGEVVDSVNVTEEDNVYLCDIPGTDDYTLVFRSDEIVYDVTVYELESSQMEGSHVSGELPVISLSTLSPNSVILLECGPSDAEYPNLMVRWVDGTGRERLSRFGVNSSGELIEIMVN